MDAVEGGAGHVHIGGGLARARGCPAPGFHQAGQVNAGCGEEPVRPLEVGAMGDGAEEPKGVAEGIAEEQAEHGGRIPMRSRSTR